jgi:uncharacterized membrane protein
MIELAVAAFLFLVGHFGVSSTPLRPLLRARLGGRLYDALYSVTALTLLAWTVSAYARAPFVAVWEPGQWTRTVPILVMPFALLALVGGVSQPNATAVAAPAAARAATPRGVFALTRHPVMWGMALWALSHLLANGDAASMILFGALAFLALAGTKAIEARKRREWSGDEWTRFAAQSSNLPFAAIAAGRAGFHFADLGWWRVGLALALHALLIGAHPYLIGVAVIPG